jgi:uncharacterized protein YjeT (DUF2065 family)
VNLLYWLAAAVGLMLVVEGLLPFAAPSRWRSAVRRLADCTDAQIRFGGMTAILAGLLILWLFA